MTMYKSERISEHITRITDIAGVACYLIEGKEKSCLLDTCCGYGNLKEYVSTLTQREPFVILTHGHYDHTGSAALFDEVYMNHLDLPVLYKHNKERAEFLKEDKKQIPALKNIHMADLNPLLRKELLPLKDGDIFDLGDLHIRMISAVGHTPGMMCALIPEEETIFFGDACGMNVLLHDEFASSVSEYRNSLVRLKKLESEYTHIYRNHGTYTNNKKLLDNVLECCELILAKKDDHCPVQMYGKTLYAAKKTECGRRTDGKEGNLIYAPEKAN